MSKKLLLLFFSLLLLSPRVASAQSVAKSGGPGKLSKVAVQKVPVQKALDELRLYYASRPDEVNQAKGSGYKPFKRMEWFIENRLNDDGTYPEGALWNAWIDKQEARQRAGRSATIAAANWTSMSPNNLINPFNSNISRTGRMLDFAFDPNNANVIYAGAASGGLWKSTDDGLSWVAMEDQLPVLTVSCIVVHPTNSNIIYFGTGEGYGNVGGFNGVGVLKSTDGGATWSNTGLSYAYSLGRKINELVIDPSNPNVLIAAASDGVHRTTDAGTNWTKTLNVTNAFDLIFDPSNSSIVFTTVNGTASTGGIYKSADNGATWTQLTTTNGLPATSTHGRISMAISTSNPQVLYASFTNTSAGLLGVYKTTDGGSNWIVTATTPNFFSNQGWYDNVTAVDPTDANTVYVGGVYIYKSTDGGGNWTDISQATTGLNGVHADVHAIEFNAGKVYVGSDGGLYRSSNGGGTWTNIGAGVHSLQYYKMGVAADNANNLMGGLQDNGIQQYTGTVATWTARRGGDGMEVVYDYTNSNIVYAENQNGSRLRSTNGGASWSGINTGAGSGPWVTPIEMDPSVPTTLYTIGTTSGDDKLYKTTDSGSNWSLLFDATEDLDKDIKVAPSNNQVIYVLGSTALYYSNNGGTSFTKGLGLPTTAMNYVAVDPTNAQIAYISRGSFSTSSGQVFKTTDGGANWTNVTNGLPSLPTNTVAIDPVYPSNVYVGNDLGVYLSTDAGASWSEWSDNLPNSVVMELDIHAGARVIRAATHGRGMWEANLYEPNPPVTANAGGDASICIGGAANLNGTAGGGDGTYTFAWTVQSGPNTSSAQFNDATLEDPTFTPTLTGVYILRFTVNDGVVSPVFDDVQITVNALPTAIVSGNATICAGSSTTLTAALTGTGPWNLTWSDGATQNGVTISPATRNVSPASTTTYTVTAISDANCTGTSSGSATVTVNPLPTATVSGDATICAGSSTTLTATLTGTGPWNLTWSDGATQNGVTISPATRNVSPTSNTTYTVTAISDANCTGTSSGSATVTVNPLPTASISGNDPVFTGTTHTYTANTNASSPSYSWSITNGTINGSNTNSTVSVTAGAVGTMIVNVSVTDGSTTCSNSATKNVTVNANTLSANAGNDDTICLGGSANLNGTASGGDGTYTFVWTVQSGPNISSTQFNDATLEDPTFTPALAGVYVLRFTVDDGVVTPVFDEVQITVNALPTATVSGSAAICAGGSTTISATLTGTGPWNLTWSDGATQNGVTISPATRNVSPTSNTTYTVTAVSDANCTGTSSGSATVTVNPLPTASISGADPVVTGTTHTYTANTNASSPSYNWSVTNGTINGSNTNNTVSVTAGGVGTMIVSLSVTDGSTTCSNSATKNVTVNANTLIANAGADKGICPGSSVQIGGSPTASGGTAPYTYSWTPTTGLNDPTLANPTASPTSATTYTVQVTDNNGATATDQVDVTINPTPVANAGADKNITSGQTVQIGGSPTASGGTAPYTYSWTPTTGLSSATVANPNASPTSTTTYTVVVTDAKGCTASDQVIVNVAGALVVNAGVDKEICSGSSVQIGGSPTASGGVAPYTYSWTPTTGLNNATLANPTTSTTSTRTYTVFVTDANGATASDQVVVTVNPKPTANAGADKNITSGQTVQIGGSPTASGGTTPYTYSWTPTTGLSSATVANPNASPTATTTYTVVVTDAKGCTASDQVIVNVASPLIVNAGADKEICTGSSVQIGGSPTASGGATPYTYTWTPTTRLNSSTSANPTASPTATTTYTVQVKDKNGIIATDQVLVSVNPKPVANAGADKTIISGQTVQIGGSPTASGGTAPYTYSWTPTSGLDNATAANPNASPTATTTYIVVVTDAKGCTASDQVLVTVVSALAANAGVDRSIVVGAPTTLGGSPAATGGIPPLTYVWSPATGLNNANVANPIAQPLSTTTYTLTVTDAASNMASDQVVVTVLPAVFLSNKVTLKRTIQTTPTGDVHSNGTLTVEAGRPSTYNSNLTAVGAITIQKDNTINGNVKSQTSISNFGIINGTKTIAPVNNVALPTLNYTAGGSSLTVPSNGTLTVTPGSYNTITINTGSTLKLMSGQYFINELRYNSSRATIEIDLTSGNPVKINVVKKLQLGAYAVMRLLPNGDTDSKLVTINTMESTSITFGHAAYLLGSFIAPKAKVTLGADSQLRGVLCANEIVIDKDCLFLPHNATASLAGPGKLTKTAGEVSELNSDDSPVINYELAQNYPNPFNPETTIRFALPEAGRAVVTVYSLTGQVVKHLINTDLAGGRYQVVWNGRNDLEAVVAGGIYFYRLTVHGENGQMKFMQTRKLTFVK